jgi:hypothetical protein
MRILAGILLVVCAVAGVAVALMGFGASDTSNSVFHEIEGILGALMATVAIAAAYIASAIDELKPKAYPPAPYPYPPSPQ